MGDATTAQGVLIDSFTRVAEMVPKALHGLSGDDLAHRPGGTGNSIAWLVWHLARIEDAQVIDMAGGEQEWTEGGWYDRSGLTFGADEHGYGHTSAQVDEVAAVTGDLLAGYHAAVHAHTVEYLEGLDPEELGRVVDPNWNPPVTVSVRLVSVVADELQHLGQASYVRGLLGHDGDLE